MKTRILSLLLATVLLLGLLTASVSAATPKNVYDYLKETAMSGDYDADNGCYSAAMPIGSSGDVFYGIYYWNSNKNVELSIFTTSFEVTLVVTSAAKLPYSAYMMLYDDQFSKGSVQVYASYNGGSYSGFSSFEGDTSQKADMLETLNSVLPAVLEYTRLVIYSGKGYTLKDMGLSSYNKCDAIHCWNNGNVTKEPTCVEQGIIVYTCAVCGQTETQYLAPTGEHTWNKGKVVTAPTCTEDGLKRYTCTVCITATKDEVLPALGHAWVLEARISEPGEGGLHSGKGRYGCTRCGDHKEAPLCASEVFTDMPEDGNWAHAPIDWAYFHIPQITDGLTETTFAPKQTCTRAQVVTFLWRAAGEPAPTSTNNPFSDVKSTDWFYKPVLWAVEKGITDGMTATTFAPKQDCNRAQVVTFLWRAAGEPAPTSTNNPFNDVKSTDWFYKPVLWAVEKGITDGMTDTTFGSKQTCTRAQVVTFLYRYDALASTAPKAAE